MTTIIKSASFVANLKCQTPGFEGFLDVHEVGKPNGWRRPCDYLTINNYCNAPEIPREERWRFVFVCHQSESGDLAYQILSRSDGQVVELDITDELGYLVWRPHSSTPLAFWDIDMAGQIGGPPGPGKYSRLGLRRVGGNGNERPFTWLGLRERDGQLIPYKRFDEDKHWFCYVSADGRAHEAPLVYDLYVLEMGVVMPA